MTLHVSCFTIHCIFLFYVSLSNATCTSQIVHYLFCFRFEIVSSNWTVFLRSTDKSLDTSLGPIRYTIRSKDGSKRMRGVMCYENAKLLRPVRKLTALPNERRFAYCNIRVVATCPLKGGYQDSVHQKGLASPCIVDRRCRPDGLGGAAVWLNQWKPDHGRYYVC